MLQNKIHLRKNTGFTLLELLIAMVIFSFMSLMAYGALANIFTSDGVISKQEIKLKKLKRAMMFIDRDMRQIVLRLRRTGYNASEFSPALVSGLDADGLIEFTRAGNSNPTDLVRSSMQRVRYDLEDGKLIRMSWNLVDHLDVEPITMPLLDDVESFELSFLSAGSDKGNKKTWDDSWSNPNKLPIAIELTMEHKGWGEIKRTFSLN